jgi:methylmalonic aciduria homocystinuria type C protein
MEGDVALNERLEDALRRRLAGAGLDLVAPLSVAAYNARVPPEWRAPTLGRPDALGVLVGNTRALWAPFVEALRREPARADAAHPLDAWVRERVGAAMRDVDRRHEVRWSSDPPPRGAAMVAAAEVAGLAWRSPAQLCVHPEYGPWIALRALIIVDADPPPPAAAAPACGACDHGCAPAVAAALRATPAPDGAAIIAEWERWLAVRDACPLGRAHRYPADQIAYHDRRDRALLRALAAGGAP